MPKLLLLFVAKDHSVRKLPVEQAEMVHPGWMRYLLSDTTTGLGDEHTVVWEQVPAGSYVELQSRITEEEVLAAAQERADAAKRETRLRRRV